MLLITHIIAKICPVSATSLEDIKKKLQNCCKARRRQVYCPFTEKKLLFSNLYFC